MNNQLIVKDPEILSGIPVFKGTRVPVQNLLDYLEAGDSIEEFLDDFPTVKKENVLMFLNISIKYYLASDYESVA
ncbi:DUF433 domain-containing protein [Cyanobacterium sp. Dongsha4]|uniref:DUF433 domain-containing protein n=1 Tax=Cyanobacterium sp. DS4 TaxID=2878255 RepID=UPI002E80D8DF|nr:DUF433 domain-containing protein [Cyanobacterium sp. Dongsha4]WVL00270.1 DUF433 domain-containing protein [Cyanobacterium sp. Dongsha4]